MKKSFLLLPLLIVACFIQAQLLPYLITGTYTAGKSEGIYVYQFNSKDGTAKEISHVKTSNPSFLAISFSQQFIYAVEENAASNGKGGGITAFSFDKATGKLTYINDKPSAGDHPCYVAIDKTGRWVTAGNYTSGSFSVLPVNSDGSLGDATEIVQHSGSGPDKSRQLSPHVHCTLFSADNKFLLVPDLGIDKVVIYNFDEVSGKVSPAAQPFTQSLAGAGPRHICFHPNNNFAYLVEELSGNVIVFKYSNGHLQKVQSISNMPAGETGKAGSADIHVSPDGRFLYATNRAESNTISIFRINKKNGLLSLIGHQSTLGKTPRNFSIDPSGKYLLIANQNSDEVVMFKRNKRTGLLTDTKNRINVGNPVCLVWVK